MQLGRLTTTAAAILVVCVIASASIPSGFAQTAPENYLDKLALVFEHRDNIMTWSATQERVALDTYPDSEQDIRALSDRIPPPPTGFIEQALAKPSRAGGGDPIVFTISPGETITTERIYPDQYELWNTQWSPNFDKLHPFDLYNDGTYVPLDRKFTSGHVLYIDYNKDGKLSNGYELLASVLDVPAWVLLSYLDSNGDGFFGKNDYFWSHARIIDASTGISYTPQELTILGFNWTHWNYIRGDYIQHNTSYLSCVSYVKDWRYWEAVKDGFRCLDFSEQPHHLRVQGLNESGVYFENGAILPMYAAVLYHWPAEGFEPHPAREVPDWPKPAS